MNNFFNELDQNIIDSQEFYEVERVLYFSVSDKTSYRIELLKQIHPIKCYNSKVYEELSGTYVLDSEFPWVQELEPEAALRETLSFLKERIGG